MQRLRRVKLVDALLWVLRIGIVVGVAAGAWATLSAGRLSPDQWRNLVIVGVAQGSLYSLIALGYTLVYGVLLMINFAHGDVFMFGAMTAFFVATALAADGWLNTNPALGLLLILAVSMLTSMIVAILLERIAYRPLRRAPRLVPLITAVGASLFISNSARGMYGDNVKAYPTIEALEGRIDILGIPVLKTQALVILTAVILMAILWWVVERTRTGRAMRAVSEDKDTAALMGINVDRVISTTFAIGGLLAGAAGILYALVFGQVHWFMGFLPGIKAFTAAVLGGIGNIFGAMLGGLSLGVVEQVGPNLLLSGAGVPSPNQLRDVVAFSVLVLVLIFRPYGILGRPGIALMPETRELRNAITLGLLGGAGLIYLCLVGIVIAFADRNVITGVLTLGRVMLMLPPLAVGYLAGRRLARPALPGRVVAGVLAGAVAGAVLGLGLLVASAVDIRGIFPRISPQVLAFVAFDQEPLVGALFNVLFGAALGVAAAVIGSLAPRYRRPIIAGLLGVLVMSMLEPFLRPRLQEFELSWLARLLYESRGLSIASSIVVFVLVSAGTALYRPARAGVQQRLERADEATRTTVRWVTGLVLIALLLSLPQLAGPLLSQVLVLVGLYVLLGLGLNIVVGYAGLLDLGYVAFYAVGAYLTALLTSPHSALGLSLPFLVALPIVVAGSALVGLLIGAPVLRLRGDYLAIVTLGFGEIARILFLSDALKPWLGGTQGILDVGPIFGVAAVDVPVLGWRLSGPTLTYYPLLFFSIVAAFVAYRLKYSRTGRAWNAMREDEDVAEATGVSIVNYKLLAFAMGAAIGCLGGAVFATHLQSVFPGSFNILVSITVLAIVILGGMGSIPGVVVGALALIGLPELLREFAEFRLLVYGAVLVVMMLLRPEGLVPDYLRQRELHDEEEELPERESARVPIEAEAP